jgi:hypothetical protein
MTAYALSKASNQKAPSRDLPPLAVPPGASHGPPLSAWVGR